MLLKNFTRTAVLIISLFFVLASCDDEATQFGLDVLPGEDKIVVKYVDTLTIPKEQITFNDERLSMNDIAYLGYFKDPFLGEMKASLFTDFHLLSGATKLDSLTSAALVSLVLHFKADTIFSGSSTAKLIFDIYEMTDSLKKYIKYDYNFDPTKFYNSAAPIGSFEINSDSIKLGEMQIRLSDEFARKFFEFDRTEVIYIDSMMKGLCIVPRSYTETGLMLTTNLGYTSSTDPPTYLELAFRYKTDSVTIDTVSTIFGFASMIPTGNNNLKKYEFPKANIIQYNHSVATVNSYLKTNVKDTALIAMNLGGAKVRLDMSNLSNFPDKNRIAIAKAELWVPYESGFYSSNYTNKANLEVFIEYPDNENKYLDYTSLYTKVGNICELDTVNKVYKLDVTNFIQSYFSESTSAKSLILSVNNSISIHHAIISRNKKAILKIKYSNF